ncbi:hypothetical protein BKP37_04740 [Anaerobacillus alkalilacustris]|uniref:DUF3267 domain-containing protein n=1 Tax=Anaerobacillus alkalilacustris TaxID=393763 RepID=A0A1S2LXZ9_9BACI|nr:DUF3267 domain-containing protein [Anaerobacillus alkalilacustris]OIJ16547.1 hypothetical protein BKP37_04740 [Anaerobacillus alkalilacustris]
MFCYKSVNVIEQYGRSKIVFFSSSAFLSFFILYYLIFRTFISNTTLHDLGFIFFIVSIYIIIPIHSLFHYIPLFITNKKIKLILKFLKGVPIVAGKVPNPVPKNLAIIVLLFPTIMITTLAIISSLLAPQLLHYISLIAAVNIGLCIYDIIPLIQIVKAPKDSYIQIYKSGYRILRTSRN